jgi:hypothetical protein
MVPRWTNSVRRENVAGTHWGHKTRLWPCLFQFDGFDERGQRRTSRAHRGDGDRVQPSFSARRHSRATPIYYERLARVAGIVANDQCAGEISQVSDLRAD